MLLLVANNGQAEATYMELVAEVALMVGVGAIVIFVARPVFTRRIWFVLIFVGVLLAVSEMSKLGISLEPPKA